MTTIHQIQLDGSRILLGLSVGNAVLDIVTDDALLGNCEALVANHKSGSFHTQIGHFGAFPITLYVHPDGTTSIFVDGPEFGQSRTQSAAIWPDRESLLRAIAEARRAHT